jgi:hypothetical protein
MVFFHVRFELGVHFIVSLLRGEFASSGKALAAIGASPRDWVPIDFFGNN